MRGGRGEKVAENGDKRKVTKKVLALASQEHEHERRGRASAISIGRRGGASCEPRSEVDARGVRLRFQISDGTSQLIIAWGLIERAVWTCEL